MDTLDTRGHKVLWDLELHIQKSASKVFLKQAEGDLLLKLESSLESIHYPQRQVVSQALARFLATAKAEHTYQPV